MAFGTIGGTHRGLGLPADWPRADGKTLTLRHRTDRRNRFRPVWRGHAPPCIR